MRGNQMLSYTRLGVALGTAMLVAITGVTTPGASAQVSGKAPAVVEPDNSPRQIYIVGYVEPALANYEGDRAGIPAPRRQGGAGGRIDVQSGEARAYVADLARQQGEHVARAGRMLGRQLQVRRRMQHALNGVVTDLTRNEAAALAGMAEVAFVEPYREYEMDTDVGPRRIGADKVWAGGSGLPPGQTLPSTPKLPGARGEGIVFGIVDSGINFGSPSFSAVASDGYHHVNPNGAGNYLGTCAPGGVDEGRCNDKLIGGYDFVCEAPGNRCGVAGILEEPGFGDTNGHGSHTASTAAGNPRTVEFRGASVNISGVAPRGNIIAYDVCYTRTSDGNGLCPNVSSAAAIDQAVADGVDVINFSIGGGAAPWSEAVSQAFLGASDAGVFVAASAGNSGPAAGTLGHHEPWVTTVAAATHGRQGFEFILDLTGPGAPPAAVQGVVLTPGGSGVAHESAIPGTTAFVVAPDFDSGTDACSAYGANVFQGAIAFVRRGGCSFSIKTNNASAAGAIAVVIANNADGGLSPSVPGTTIPAFAITRVDGDAVRDFASGVSATAAIGYPAQVIANTPDVLGAFSSRGPANYELVKPDITAPGVAVLAADAGSTIEGFEDLVGLKNGTSMASPHVAGAAGLIKQLNPTWTPAEIKSALMMTADQEVYIEDGETRADAFAMGAGRVQVRNASRTGLVMDETTANYLAANPVEGGDTSTLNLPSMNEQACVGFCTFTRTFRSVRRPNVLWTARLEGVKGIVWPALFMVKGDQEVSLTVIVDGRKLPADDSWNFGKLVLEPVGHSPHVATLRLPVAVSVPSPRIATAPADGASLTLKAGRRGVVAAKVANEGGGWLEWNHQPSGAVSDVVYASTSEGVTTGTLSAFMPDYGSGFYAADDFVMEEGGAIDFLATRGFVVSGASLQSTASSITWSIYADDGGKPAGYPRTPGSTPPLWTYTAAPNSAGIGVSDSWLQFDPTLAGQDVQLPPGTYWLHVHVETLLANRWAWYQSLQGIGGQAQVVQSPELGGTWGATSATNPGLAFQVNAASQCGAAWIGAVLPGSGRVYGGTDRTVLLSVNAAGLAPGEYRARACFASNDPSQPVASLPVRLTVTP
ncbi:S8 family serine peptidase [Lysobacter aestuarii]|uniref:S8 family serine peptidase n=2 Tax=Marilutibacter aestuarii TaxID=1706195 RepID=A0A507ZYZ8_9GAMM|nr:S8 family serine peptidase [Lysobacter aestuarii]